MRTETVIVLLFGIAGAIALLARSLKVPYTVALVIAGLSIGAMRIFPAPHLTKDLLYAVFLPGLNLLRSRLLMQSAVAAEHCEIVGIRIPDGETLPAPDPKHAGLLRRRRDASVIGS